MNITAEQMSGLHVPLHKDNEITGGPGRSSYILSDGTDLGALIGKNEATSDNPFVQLLIDMIATFNTKDSTQLKEKPAELQSDSQGLA